MLHCRQLQLQTLLSEGVCFLPVTSITAVLMLTVSCTTAEAQLDCIPFICACKYLAMLEYPCLVTASGSLLSLQFAKSVFMMRASTPRHMTLNSEGAMMSGAPRQEEHKVQQSRAQLRYLTGGSNMHQGTCLALAHSNNFFHSCLPFGQSG